MDTLAKNTKLRRVRVLKGTNNNCAIIELQNVTFFVENDEQMAALNKFVSASDIERTRMLAKAAPEKIEAQKCICCHKDSVIDLGPMSFCKRCLFAGNIFVDAKPIDIILPANNGFLTPNFKAFLARKDKSITWFQFDQEYQR